MSAQPQDPAVIRPAGGAWSAELAGPREAAAPAPRRAGSDAPGRALSTRHAGLSDCGPHRAKNEDAYLVDARLGLYIVCDGVGGRRSGEIAASVAVDRIHEQVHGALHAIDGERERGRCSLDDLRGIVRLAMQRASRAIFELGSEDARLAGMSTTASVALVVGDFAVIGQVGDTRVYHGRGDSARQVTEDHTLRNMRVQRGLVDGGPARRRKSPITRALGLRDAVEVDIYTTRLAAGDRLLLCTDGLHEHLEPDAVLERLFRMELREAAPAAIRHARRCGGKDNATAVFVEIPGHG